MRNTPSWTQTELNQTEEPEPQKRSRTDPASWNRSQLSGPGPAGICLGFTCSSSGCVALFWFPLLKHAGILEVLTEDGDIVLKQLHPSFIHQRFKHQTREKFIKGKSSTFKMFVFESDLLETALFVVVVLILLLLWLNVAAVSWNRIKSAEIIAISLLLIVMFLLGLFSFTHLVFGIVILSLHSDLFEPGWNRLISVMPGGNQAKITGVSVLLTVMFLLGLFSFTHLVFGIMILSVYGDLSEPSWNSGISGRSHAQITGASVLTIMMFVFGSVSSALLVLGVLMFSPLLLNITVVRDSIESGWNRFKSVVPGDNNAKIVGASILMIMMFLLGLFSLTHWVIGNLILCLHHLNLPIVTDLFESVWNHFKSIIPGENHANLVGVSVLVTMMFCLGSVSLVVLVFGDVILLVHLINLTTVRDSLESSWNHFKSVILGENHAKVLRASVLTIMMFVFGSVSSALVVLGVLIFLSYKMNITVVTDSIEPGGNCLKSVFQREHLVKMLEETTLKIKMFIGDSNPSIWVKGVLIFSVHLVNFIIVRESLEPGFIPGEKISTVTITMFVCGSVSSALLVLGVLIISSHLLNVTVVRDSCNSFWNRFSSVVRVYILQTIDGRGQLANVVRERSTLLTPQIGSLLVYKIPLKDKQTDSKGYKYYSFGKKSTKPNRTIVLVGAAGEEKSKVISGMINYILGVQWTDSYRFKLVDEDQVSIYKIYHQTGFKIDYSLTIVDTPGFGDSGDEEISEQLRKLFYCLHDVGEVDAVCFVAPAALTQLTPAQKCMFDSILSIFGKDVAENIRILVTSADDQLPPVLEAIRVSGVSCPRTDDGLPVYFKFNNSALFADSTSENFHQMFWNMGTSSMMSFFSALVCIKTFRVTVTAEALGDRWQVESEVENLQMQVKLGLAKLEKIKETIGKVKELKAEISRNEDFEFYVTVKKPVKVDISGTGQHITNCQQCQVTCHFPCGIPNDDGKRGCSAMGQNGYCQVCPGKCFWNVHLNQKFKWEYQEVKEKRTSKELQENFEDFTEEKMTGQRLVDELVAEHEEVQNELLKMIQMSAHCLNRLKEMAQQPNNLSTPEYIELLINGEKREAKAGWEQRVDFLMKVKQKAESEANVEK